MYPVHLSQTGPADGNVPVMDVSTGILSRGTKYSDDDVMTRQGCDLVMQKNDVDQRSTKLLLKSDMKVVL
jgi:hypothetical protein